MNLFEFYESIDAQAIRRFIAEKREESLHLEFKLVSGATLQSLDDKRNFAKALSGFANSSGGIVVWGVDCRKDGGDADFACGIDPIKPLSAFLSRLTSLTGEYVSPDVEGVDHKPILIGDDEGCAVSFIPQSDRGPHMAKAGEDRYYKRSGDSFYRMEHFDIADMFGRRPKAILRLSHEMRCEGAGSDSQRKYASISFVISLENLGKGAAKSPFIQVHLHSPYNINRYGIDGNGREGLPRLVSSSQSRERWTSYGSRTDYVLLPGMKMEIFAVSPIRVYRDSAVTSPAFDYQIGAEEIPVLEGRYEIPAIEILKKALDSYPDITPETV